MYTTGPNATASDNYPSAISLHEALKNTTDNKECYVYKLSVGGKEYIGFTAQNPSSRLEQHLESAKTGSKQKVHVALRRFGFLHDFKVLSSHPNEILALVEEISAIEKYSPKLNTTIGGEGANYLVVEKTNEYNEKAFYVVKKAEHEQEITREKAKQFIANKSTHDYLLKLSKKIVNRYMLIESRLDQNKLECLNETYKYNPKGMSQNPQGIWQSFMQSIPHNGLTRESLTSFWHTLRSKIHEVKNLDPSDFQLWKYLKKYDFTIRYPNRITHVKSKFFKIKQNVFSAKQFPSTNYMIDVSAQDLPIFDSEKAAVDKISKSNWFKEGISNGTFKLKAGIDIYPIYISCGTYQTGFLNLVTKTDYKSHNISVNKLIKAMY